MRRFDAISVRERKSLAFLKDNYNIDASFTLDPILMLNEKQWTLFFDDNTDAFKATGTSEYIGCYFLDITESSVDYLNRLEKLLERNTIVLRGTDSSNIYGYEFPDEIVDASLPAMVKFIKNASFILTDSYHGCCISIAFHVPFIAIINERRGGSRFRSLLNELGLHDRMVSIGDNDKLCLGEIDWQDVDKRLACLKRSSENWLQEALSCGIKERNPIEEQWLKFSIMEMCLHETQKKADIAYAYANELRNKIVKPREKRIVDYIEKEIPQGAIVAYRGGGYHTACLDSILRPLFVKKNIEVIGIIDRGNTKLGLGYTYYQPSDSILNNIEYLILSSAKYRN